MKAAVIHAPGKISCDTVEDPKIKEQTDIILKVTATAICGSDLHIYSGGIPQPRPMVFGHEFMGIVEETGTQVKKLKRVDRVVVPFPIACGSCFSVVTICLATVKIAIHNTMGLKVVYLHKKAEPCLDIPICTVVMTAARLNMYGCRMQTWVPGWFLRV